MVFFNLNDGRSIVVPYRKSEIFEKEKQIEGEYKNDNII